MKKIYLCKPEFLYRNDPIKPQDNKLYGILIDGQSISTNNKLSLLTVIFAEYEDNPRETYELCVVKDSPPPLAESEINVYKRLIKMLNSFSKARLNPSQLEKTSNFLAH